MTEEITEMLGPHTSGPAPAEREPMNQFRVFRKTDLAAGAEWRVFADSIPQYWHVSMYGAAATDLIVAAEHPVTLTDGIPLQVGGVAIIPAHGPELYVRNVGSTIPSITVIALSGFERAYYKPTG